MSLNNLKKRIVSVKTTSKITNAMKLMASGKLQKQKRYFAETQSYYSTYYQLIGNLITCIKQPKNEPSKVLHIVINSQLGLCGGYNINVSKQVLNSIKEDDFLIQLGVRSKELYKNKLAEGQILKPFKFEVNNMAFLDCLCLSKYINLLLNESKIDGIKIHYTKFLNAISFNAETLNILPYDEKFKESIQDSGWNINQMEFEPSLNEIINDNFANYMATIIHACLTESLISENASRRNAMDTATQNATELIENLSIKYNRERQSKITNEITEITAGSEVS
ncbi:MAG: ATP synthase F1 subunit gamma [Mycoplasma sp.]